MTHDNVTDIVERLVAEKYESDEHGIWAIPRNPEGREAAQDELLQDAKAKWDDDVTSAKEWAQEFAIPLMKALASLGDKP